MRSIPAIARSSVSAYGASRAGVSTMLGAGAGPERPSLQGFRPYVGVLHRTLCLYERRNVEALATQGRPAVRRGGRGAAGTGLPVDVRLSVVLHAVEARTVAQKRRGPPWRPSSTVRPAARAGTAVS